MFFGLGMGAGTGNVPVVDVPNSPQYAILSTPTADPAPEDGTTDITATLVDDGGDAPTYQWYVNGSPVVGGSGATTLTYTTPVVTWENRGDVYKCRATNGAGFNDSPEYALEISNVKIWYSLTEIAALPATSDPLWDDCLGDADGIRTGADVFSPTFIGEGNGDDNRMNRALACIIAYKKTATAGYLTPVIDLLSAICNYDDAHPENEASNSSAMDVLNVARHLGALCMCAELIDLATNYSALDTKFRSWLTALVIDEADLEGGRGSLLYNFGRRPNNWGPWCGASYTAAALYLGNTTAFNATIPIWKGMFGDRTAYSSFVFDTSGNCAWKDLTWHPDPNNPHPINPLGATIGGNDVSGVIPDDQRRTDGAPTCSSYSWPPDFTDYHWEFLQGAMVGAEILYRQGQDSWNWSDQALKRAHLWATNTTFSDASTHPAIGEDGWQISLLNKRCGTELVPTTSWRGKMLGWTELTHAV